MITIAKTPLPYSPARHEVIYEISGADPDRVIDVEIFAMGENIARGAKRLRGEASYRINAGAYLRRIGCVEPLTKAATGIYPVPERVVHSRIVAGGVASPQVALTAGTISIQALMPMTSYRGQRIIGMDESDEISFIAPAGEYDCEIVFKNSERSHSVEIGSATTPEGINTLCIRCGELAQRLKNEGIDMLSFDEFEARVMFNGGKIFGQSYRLAESGENRVRIAWVNPYGAIDCFTFYSTGEEEQHVRRVSVETMGGEVTIAAGSRACRSLTSGYRRREVMETLVQLATSTDRWRIGANGTVGKIDITTRDVVPVEGNELSKMDVVLYKV